MNIRGWKSRLSISNAHNWNAMAVSIMIGGWNSPSEFVLRYSEFEILSAMSARGNTSADDYLSERRAKNHVSLRIYPSARKLCTCSWRRRSDSKLCCICDVCKSHVFCSAVSVLSIQGIECNFESPTRRIEYTAQIALDTFLGWGPRQQTAVAIATTDYGHWTELRSFLHALWREFVSTTNLTPNNSHLRI